MEYPEHNLPVLTLYTKEEQSHYIDRLILKIWRPYGFKGAQFTPVPDIFN